MEPEIWNRASRLALLRTLSVRDYALIERLDVEFDAGLNIITGETGAGKSILIGALQMILGERASTDVVRTGASKAVVEGIFDDASEESIRVVLEANEIEPQPVVILRREITASYSRGFINDTPATLPVMREIASSLIDLHGQHEHQSLLNVGSHLELLDGFAGLQEKRAKTAGAYRHVAELVERRRELLSRKRGMEQQKELFGFQIAEIDRATPRRGEEEELENERRVLENAEQLFEATAALASTLYESDASLHDQLASVRSELQDLARIDVAFEDTLKEIESALIVTSEAAKFIQHYHGGIEFNPDRLEEIRVRLSELDRLKRKYGGSLEAVIAHREEIGRAYEIAQDFDGALSKLEIEISRAQSALSEAAADLSRRRKEAAIRVEEEVVRECFRLGMPDSQFAIRFDVDADPDGWISTEEAGRVRAFESGMDVVEFFISTNAGEVPKPLARVASGGEISRIMLALKTILARSRRFPILVFDEIDVGISGAVASMVGRSMHDLAASHQIIAITHLPQIAAMGDVHFLVDKLVENSRTKTRIRRLEEDHRAHHVASLMSGAEVGESALVSARELLDASKRIGE